MFILKRIIDVFMAIGAIPATMIVVPLEEIFDEDIAGTWIAGTLAAGFGMTIIAAFITGIVSLLS